jgi:D-3-phosphoglycerate dehydrogenase
MKVLFIDSVHPILEQRLTDLKFICEHDYHSSREKLLSKMSNYDGVIIRSRTPVDKEFLDAASQLKFIARSGAGIENIDLDEANQRSIFLFSAPEGNRQAVGEHSVAMLLNLFNKINIADKEVRNGAWNREANRGLELSNKTVGIIGFGNMGNAFAKCLSGFNCKIYAYDTEIKKWPNSYAKQTTIEQIQEEADIISFHTPYDRSTHHYFNDEFIEKMQKNFFLINTARGKVVATSSLVNGIKSGKVLGACLDVLEYEKSTFEKLFETTMSKDFEYLIHSNRVILSPHIAGWTVESYEKLATVLADKIEAIFR